MNTWETEFLAQANIVKVRHDAESTIVTPYNVLFWSRPLKTLCAGPLVARFCVCGVKYPHWEIPILYKIRRQAL